MEFGAASGAVGGVETAAMHLDDATADRQAQAGAAGAVLGRRRLDEGVEDALELVDRDAGAAVRDAQVERAVGRAVAEQLDRAAGRCELDRVGQHVAHRLLDAQRIQACRHRGGQLGADHELALGDQRRELAQHRADRLAQVLVAQVQRADGALELGGVQQVVDQRQHALPGSMDVREHRMQPLLRAAAHHAELGEAEDGLQRRAQLVADVGEEFGLGARGLFRRVARLARQALGGGPFGDVDGAARVAEQLTIAAQRHRRDLVAARRAFAVADRRLDAAHAVLAIEQAGDRLAVGRLGEVGEPPSHRLVGAAAMQRGPARVHEGQRSGRVGAEDHLLHALEQHAHVALAVGELFVRAFQRLHRLGARLQAAPHRRGRQRDQGQRQRADQQQPAQTGVPAREHLLHRLLDAHDQRPARRRPIGDDDLARQGARADVGAMLAPAAGASKTGWPSSRWPGS